MKTHVSQPDRSNLTAVYLLSLGLVVGFGLGMAIPRVIQLWL